MPRADPGALSQRYIVGVVPRADPGALSQRYIVGVLPRAAPYLAPPHIHQLPLRMSPYITALPTPH